LPSMSSPKLELAVEPGIILFTQLLFSNFHNFLSIKDSRFFFHLLFKTNHF
jgi:hypothetical protein